MIDALGLYSSRASGPIDESGKNTVASLVRYRSPLQIPF